MKLPKVEGYMTIGQGTLLEVLHLLVDEGVVSEDTAAKRYYDAKERFKSWL